MSEYLKNNILPLLTIVIVVVGLVTTSTKSGFAEGVTEQRVTHLEQEDKEMCDNIASTRTDLTNLQSEMQFFRGTLIEKVDSQGKNIDEFGRRQEQMMDMLIEKHK